MSTPLCDLFLPGLAEELRQRTPADPGLEQVLHAILVEARRAWPKLSLGDEVFLPHLAGRIAADGDVAAALPKLNAGDVFLACACARGDPAALAALDPVLAREVASAVASLEIAGADTADVTRRIRQRLIAGDEPRILEYGGRGELRAWIRVIAVRDALQIERKLRREMPFPDDALPMLPETYRRDFQEAFLGTLQVLSSRERNVLRHHLLHELNIDEIGALYHVHRATAARWIAKARERLLVGTKRRLTDKLKIGKPELDGIMRLIQTHLDVSIHRFLHTMDPQR